MKLKLSDSEINFLDLKPSDVDALSNKPSPKGVSPDLIIYDELTRTSEPAVITVGLINEVIYDLLWRNK